MNHRWTGIFLSLLFIFYMTLQSRAFLFAPRLLLNTPAIIRAAVGQEIKIEGEAIRQSRVSIDGQEISLDRDGKFSQLLIAREDTRALEVKAVNRFGQENTKLIQVIVK